MAPEEFKAARKQLGLTQSELAKVLGVSLITVQRSEIPAEKKSSSKPHATMVRAMGWFLSGFRPPEWPQGKG
ncbi:helix-turn-helix domain-containing protein [Polycladidibacter hongkongensis]|uniref:helix-turn-helix domain-containing protein n=1 Tax=Polycladidibacter hongkongensis TaxID=1647556 RepID=UPI00082E80FF|nr:helix-turn-helix domain-containing protein [Pseudovibrio hongkongensis]